MEAVLSTLGKYTPRAPRKSNYYRLVEAHCEQLERVWDEVYQPKYGFWRPYIMDVIYKFLDCGDPHHGFARVKCQDCKHEYILPFSCKRRHFCPSCHQKRVIEFGEHLNEKVLDEVYHRQWVFSIPKRLRQYFMYDRKLLSKLSLCAWRVLSEYLKCSVSLENPIPGAIISVQTFGEFLNFNPHLHIIITDGCFDEDGKFMKACTPNAVELEAVFASEVFDMLIEEDKIERSLAKSMSKWEHSGFNVYCSDAISPWSGEVIERLAQYIVRAPLSQERMEYLSEKTAPDGVAKVVYEGKTSRSYKSFTALDWLARLITHIPNKGEQLVRYYGYYSNKSRGVRKKCEKSEEEQKEIKMVEESGEVALFNSDLPVKKRRKSWARLLQKVFNVDPLLCPKCEGTMKIISFIEDHATIKEILVHLKLWMNHDPPKYGDEFEASHEGRAGSFAWWESGTSESVKKINALYEDDFSQLVAYDD